MRCMADLSSNIEADAVKPKATSNGDVSSTRRDMRELIEADRYLADKEAGGNVGNVLKNSILKIVPPGGC